MRCERERGLEPRFGLTHWKNGLGHYEMGGTIEKGAWGGGPLPSQDSIPPRGHSLGPYSADLPPLRLWKPPWSSASSWKVGLCLCLSLE